MNFTRSGVNRNEEFVELNCDPHMIGEAITEFERQYLLLDHRKRSDVCRLAEKLLR